MREPDGWNVVIPFFMRESAEDVAKQVEKLTGYCTRVEERKHG